MKTRSLIASVSALLLLSTGSAQVFETEPNDTVAQANAMPEGIFFSAQLSSSTDVDTYQRSVLTAGALDISFALAGNAPSGDFSVALLNASGTTLASYRTSYSRSFSQLVGVPSAGNYYIQVKAGSSLSHSSGQYSIAAPYVPLVPVIIRQPESQSVTAGSSVMYSVVANGMPPLSYQWYWNGVALANQTSSSLSFSDLMVEHSGGKVTVIVRNASGSVTSAEALLTVTARGPTITTHPVSQSVSVGTSVTLSVQAAGTPPLAYQWRRNGAAIAGATGSSFIISSVSASDAASYTATVSNASGSVTSNLANLTVVPLPNPARLINLSVMTNFATNQSLTMGFVVGGTGNRRVLVRAVGPTLRSFNVSPPMSNPRLTLFNAQGVAIGSNDNWSSADAATMAAVGAFALPVSSLDAALVATLSPGNHTVTVGGALNDSGYALVEVYEVP